MLKCLGEIRILSCSPTASPLTFESGQVWTFMDIQNMSRAIKSKTIPEPKARWGQPMVQNPEADLRNGLKEVKDETQVSGTNEALISYRNLLIVEPYRSLHCFAANMLVWSLSTYLFLHSKGADFSSGSVISQNPLLFGSFCLVEKPCQGSQ